MFLPMQVLYFRDVTVISVCKCSVLGITKKSLTPREMCVKKSEVKCSHLCLFPLSLYNFSFISNLHQKLVEGTIFCFYFYRLMIHWNFLKGDLCTYVLQHKTGFFLNLRGCGFLTNIKKLFRGRTQSSDWWSEKKLNDLCQRIINICFQF